MSSAFELAASYGQIGLMLWIVFEVRDVRRCFREHIETHHAKIPIIKIHG